jgi:hypothetical protein
MWIWIRKSVWYWIPKSFKRQCAEEIGAENESIKQLLRNYMNSNQALSLALGETFGNGQQEYLEKLTFLGAVALQSNGEFILPRIFLETVSNGQYKIEIHPDKENLIIRLKQNEVEDSTQEEDENPTCCDNEGCNC